MALAVVEIHRDVAVLKVIHQAFAVDFVEVSLAELRLGWPSSV